MDQLFIRLLEKDWRKRNTVVEPDTTAPLRSNEQFIKELDFFLLYKREEYVDCAPLIDPSLGTILTKSSNETILLEHSQLSVIALLTLLDERCKTRIKFLMNEQDKDRIQKKLKNYNKHYRNKALGISIYTLYEEFLSQWSLTHNDTLCSHIQNLTTNQYDIYDLCALSLIHYRMTQKSPNEEFGLLFIDEAQDFGIAIYYVLRKLLPATYFTIMGDVSQNINYYTGLNDWYDLQKLFINSPKDEFMLLQKSYRNTIEISQYAGSILEHASFGKYKIDPVIRHGIPVNEKNFWSDF